MGQNLSEPKTDKQTETQDNELFAVGASCMQGWRLEMEDSHSVQLHYAQDPHAAYFAVFDGHGSSKFATYCGSQLHHHLLNELDFRNGKYAEALRSGFLSVDRALMQDPEFRMQHEPGGTTAIVTVIKGNKIYCGNAGDSRAVACVAGEVQELSHDHKPFNPVEEARIYKAGGWVEFNRVNGNLALSRAIGDFNFKSNPDLPQAEQIVTAEPEVVTVDVTPDHEFIVLACDGVWDVMSNVEVVEFVRKKIASNMKPPMICEALLDHCLAPDCRMGGVGCDNMSVILACCLHRDSYSELVFRCSVDSHQISRSRRFSSFNSLDHRKMNSRGRRMSDPPPLRGSPIISSKLADVVDSTRINGSASDVPTLEEEREDGEIGEKGKGEEGEGDEFIPLETTL